MGAVRIDIPDGVGGSGSVFVAGVRVPWDAAPADTTAEIGRADQARSLSAGTGDTLIHGVGA